jgi:hypothetical protein
MFICTCIYFGTEVHCHFYRNINLQGGGDVGRGGWCRIIHNESPLNTNIYLTMMDGDRGDSANGDRHETRPPPDQLRFKVQHCTDS